MALLIESQVPEKWAQDRVHMYSLVVLTIIFTALLLLILLLGALLRTRKGLQRHFRLRLAQYQERLNSFKARMALIEPYALDYMNSLRPGTTQAMLQVRQIVTTHEHLVEHLHRCLMKSDYKRYPDAITILEKVLLCQGSSGLSDWGGSSSSVQRAIRNVFTGSERLPPIARNWQVQTDGLIQEIGHDILRASKQAHALGLPRNRTRKPTLGTLSQAGIIDAMAAEGKSSHRG